MKTAIFTYTHKDFKPLTNVEGLYFIVTGGRLQGEYPMPVIEIPDDDPLFLKKDIYCELSAAYYVWKHPELIADREYVGIQHYSRWWSDWTRIEGLFETQGCDCIVTNVNNTMSISSYEFQQHYHKSLKEFDFCLDYIRKNHPEYGETIDSHIMKKDVTYWCNMAIMRKEMFLQYCSFIFEAIEAMNREFNLVYQLDFDAYHEKNKGNNNFSYDMYYKRLNGYIGELLTSLFVRHNCKKIEIMSVTMNK